MYKRTQIYSQRQRFLRPKNKRLYTPVDQVSRKKHVADNDSKIDKHQKQKHFSFPVYTLLLHPDNDSYYQP